MPHWISVLLESGGLWGAIVFVLLSVITGLVAYIRTLHTKADKIYGYRLTERDTLTKVLGDTAKVIEGIIKANEDRNDLTEEQSLLIREQAHAFELLKASVVAQYDNIKDHNAASALAVSSMAEAIRALNSIVIENRTIATGHVLDVKGLISSIGNEIKSAVSTASQSQMIEMRSLLGNVTLVHRNQSKRRVPK